MYSETIFKIFNDQRLIFIVTLVFAVLLAYQLSILIWKFVPQPDIQQSEMPVASVPVSNQSAKTLSTREKTAQIASQHLFGRSEQVKSAAPAAVQDAPRSTLKYKLRGIYYSSEQSLSSVILQKDANKSKFYRLGDEVDRNIYIAQIQADHILIDRNGRMEKLVLEKPTTNLAGVQRRPTASFNASASPASKVLKNYRRRYKDNPMALAKRFQAIPVQENGKNIGYKLKALRGERLLQKLKLQRDDVFMEINGIGLDKPFQALDALKSLTTADNVALTIIRNGNRQTLDFNLK